MDYFLTEDVDLATDQSSEPYCDIVSIILRKNATQTLESMDEHARGITTTKTQEKGASLWWSVPEAYAVPLGAGTQTGWDFFADEARERLNEVVRCVIVCEKLVPEEVNLVATTRRSGDFGTGAQVGGTGKEVLDAHYYVVDRHPTVYQKLKDATDQGEKYNSANDMLNARKKNGYVYNTRLGNGMRRPCWGDVVIDNPLYVAKGVVDDNVHKPYTLMPHMHLMDAEWHFSQQLDGGGTYQDDTPIMRFTVGVYYSASKYSTAAGVTRVALPSPFRVMPLADYDDVLGVDGYVLPGRKEKTKNHTPNQKALNQVMQRAITRLTGEPDPEPEPKDYATKVAGYGPDMAPIETLGWHFFDPTKEFGDEEGIINTDDLDNIYTVADELKLAGLDSSPKTTRVQMEDRDFKLRVAITGLPEGHGTYKMLRFGGEDDPAIYKTAVQGFMGPGKGMGRYTISGGERDFYEEMSNCYMWNPSLGRDGGYELYDFETRKAVEYSYWPVNGSRNQTFAPQYPFKRFPARDPVEVHKAKKSMLDGTLTKTMFRSGGVIGIAAEMGQLAKAQFIEAKILPKADIPFLIAALAILSCATEVVRSISNALAGYQAKTGGGRGGRSGGRSYKAPRKAIKQTKKTQKGN